MYQCLIVDDEPLAVEVIENHLSHFPDIHIAATCHHAMDAAKWLNETAIDLIFLDIQMPQMTGVDFLRNLSHRPQVILTTAYRDYALEGYDLDVLDYLLKPISFQRFFKAIQKFYHVCNASENQSFIYVKSEKKLIKLFLNDILFMESMKDYILVHTRKQTHITRGPMKEWEKQFSNSQMVRIHRSFLINPRHIRSLTSHSAILTNGKELPLGRYYKETALKSLHIQQHLLE